MKNPWVIIGVLTVVLFGGAFWYASVAGEKANEGVEVIDHVKGNPDSEVVLVEYSDFQCPACGQFYPVVKSVLEEHGDSIRFEYRHFPLISIHPYAEPAARAAEAAGQQGKFYEFHDKLFENQQQWSSAANPSQFFNQYANELELDMDAFRAHQKSSILRDRIRSHMDEAIDRGVTGTPTFFLNGNKIQLQTLGDLNAAVEAALGISDTATTTDGAATSSGAETQSDAGAGLRFGI